MSTTLLASIVSALTSLLSSSAIPETEKSAHIADINAGLANAITAPLKEAAVTAEADVKQLVEGVATTAEATVNTVAMNVVDEVVPAPLQPVVNPLAVQVLGLFEGDMQKAVDWLVAEGEKALHIGTPPVQA